MYGHAARIGNARKGSTQSPTSDEPQTISAVSSVGSPAADLSNAFHDACRNAAPSTASVTPSVNPATGAITRSRRQRDAAGDGEKVRERRRGGARELGAVVPDPQPTASSTSRS